MWRKKRSLKSKLLFRCRMPKMQRNLFQELSFLHSHSSKITLMITTIKAETITIIKIKGTTSIRDQDMDIIKTTIETMVDTMISSSTMITKTNSSLGKTMFKMIGSLIIKSSFTIKINIITITHSSSSNISNRMLLKQRLFILHKTGNRLASIHDKTINSLINKTSEAVKWMSIIRLLFRTLDRRFSLILTQHFTQLKTTLHNPINLRFLKLMHNHLSQLVIQVSKNGTHKTISKLLIMIKTLGNKKDLN